MKNLIAAAKELNAKLGVDPAIKTVAVKRPKLEEQLIEAAGLIQEDDVISEETLEVLYELGAIERPEEEVEEPEDDEMEALIESVQTEEDLKELKKLIKSHDEFLDIRKKAPGMFDIDEVRAAMLECLGVELEEVEEPEEEPEEVKEPVKKAARKGVPPAPVKKGTPAPEKKESGEKKAMPNTRYEGSMAQVMDAVTKEGGSWEDMAAKVQAVSDERFGGKKVTPGGLKSHANFRLSKNEAFYGKKKITETGIK